MVVAALHLGREVLIPFALALLFSFLLARPVAWLEYLRLPRVPAVLLVLTLAFAIVGESSWVGLTQLSDIVNQLPRYQENIRRKIEAIRNPAGFGLTKAAQSIGQLTKALEPGALAPEHPAATLPIAKRPRISHFPPPSESKPVPVEVVRHSPDVVDSVNVIGTPIAHLLASGAAVVILTLFMLIQRSDLRNRFFRLFGPGHLNVMTTAMDDAALRVSKYLLTQSLVNGAFGLLLGFGLYCIGVPNAAFWGVLGALLRFIPYVGTLIAGACPLILALAVFEGWEKPLLTAGLFAAIELTLSGFIEPWMYGSHTGISSLAILVSAAFWTLLWGPIGLVLSTPLTVCLLVLGRHVPTLQFFTVLLGDEPVLPLKAQFYQRLLAMDDDEARDVAENFLKENTFGDLYDSVVVPALSLAEHDRHQNALDEERERFIFQSTREIIEDFADRNESGYAEPLPAAPSIVCIPARDEADELVAMMLAHLLRQAGYRTHTVAIASVEQMLSSIKEHQPGIVFVSALPPFAVGHARSVCRRIRQLYPRLKLVMGLWDSAIDIDALRKRLGPACSDSLITTLSQAEAQARLVAEQMHTNPAGITN